MELELEDLAKAKSALKRDRVNDAAVHAVAEWDRMFRLLFKMEISDATPQRIERRYKKMSEDVRPSWALIQALVARRAELSGDGGSDAAGVAELISGMEAIIKQSREAFHARGFD